ncbi:hypothetical protein [Actinoplanes sp. NPDC051859]|uniref:hypothetical protein n=1 Tax=Actinoplanes sp. NPDC051859 TaxID=3363909 RepID=UPI0037B788F6
MKVKPRVGSAKTNRSCSTRETDSEASDNVEVAGGVAGELAPVPDQFTMKTFTDQVYARPGRGEPCRRSQSATT